MILINSSPKDAARIFQKFLPISVPIGIGFLISSLKREGIEAVCIDEQVEDDILAKINETVKGMSKPYIFGFSVLTVAMKNAVELSKKLKELYPDSFIVFGGIHPTALPDEILEYDHIDAVIRGEGEKPLAELYKFIKKGGFYKHIPGLSYKINGEIVHNAKYPVMDDLSKEPIFPYHLFTNKKYDLGFVMSSRGCPFDCIFCSNRIVTGKKYRFRPANVIVDELEILYNRGIKSVGFLDDNFLVSKSRIYDLIHEIKIRELDKKMVFSFQARGDSVNRSILQELFDAGFKSIFFGMETTNPEIMKFIKKGETVEQCVDAVKMAKDIGYHVSATFIYGLGESHDDRMDCVRVSNELRIDLIRYNNATPYPGTELFEIAKKSGRLNVVGQYENFISVSTFIESPFNPIPFTYVPEGSTESEIRRDILYSYFRFYFDWQRIKTIFIKPEMNVGWFDAKGSMMDTVKKIPYVIGLGCNMGVKFLQLFYYGVIKKESRISTKFFLSVFG